MKNQFDCISKKLQKGPFSTSSSASYLREVCVCVCVLSVWGREREREREKKSRHFFPFHLLPICPIDFFAIERIFLEIKFMCIFYILKISSNLVLMLFQHISKKPKKYFSCSDLKCTFLLLLKLTLLTFYFS